MVKSATLPYPRSPDLDASEENNRTEQRGVVDTTPLKDEWSAEYQGYSTHWIEAIYKGVHEAIRSRERTNEMRNALHRFVLLLFSINAELTWLEPGIYCPINLGVLDLITILGEW